MSARTRPLGFWQLLRDQLELAWRDGRIVTPTYLELKRELVPYKEECLLKHAPEDIENLLGRMQSIEKKINTHLTH